MRPAASGKPSFSRTLPEDFPIVWQPHRSLAGVFSDQCLGSLRTPYLVHSGQKAGHIGNEIDNRVKIPVWCWNRH